MCALFLLNRLLIFNCTCTASVHGAVGRRLTRSGWPRVFGTVRDIQARTMSPSEQSSYSSCAMTFVRLVTTRSYFGCL